MTRLHFLLTSFFAAVGALFGFHRPVSRDDFEVTTQLVDWNGDPRLRAIIYCRRDGCSTGIISPTLRECGIDMARQLVQSNVDFVIDQRIATLNA